MRGSCVEIPMNAPLGKDRLAHKGRRIRILRTPERQFVAHLKSNIAHGKSPQVTPHVTPPSAAGMANQDLFELDALQKTETDGNGSTSRGEADADESEVKDAVDENGAVRITD